MSSLATSNKDHIARFFCQDLISCDPILAELIKQEQLRQQNQIELVASENMVSQAVLDAQGSALTNKYSEGYPYNRCYPGCAVMDEIEQLAIERAKKLFNGSYANVQPNSGSQMNQAVFLALLQPGDNFLSMDPTQGGHMTHGAANNISGKWFKPHFYGVRQSDNLIDMEQVEYLAKKIRPKLIITGTTCYSRDIDWAAFRQIAEDVGAYLMADVSHIGGLIAGGAHSSPLPHVHILTTTTHKSLRGPRGGLIICNEKLLAEKIDKAVFPGLQGGPLMHIIAAKAVAFGQALQPEFKQYSKKVVEAARFLAEKLQQKGLDIVTNGTDNHLLLLDLRKKNITGAAVEQALSEVNIICNKNAVPFDDKINCGTSGVRFGTASTVTRGFSSNEYTVIAQVISDIVEALAHNTNITQIMEASRAKIAQLTNKFPIYQNIK